MTLIQAKQKMRSKRTKEQVQTKNRTGTTPSNQTCRQVGGFDQGDIKVFFVSTYHVYAPKTNSFYLGGFTKVNVTACVAHDPKP